jgi:hypothetical protein
VDAEYHGTKDANRSDQPRTFATETVAQQLRVEEGFPLLMITRIIYGGETNQPVVFSQDFLRGDYARIHTDIKLKEIGPKVG